MKGGVYRMLTKIIDTPLYLYIMYSPESNTTYPYFRTEYKHKPILLSVQNCGPLSAPS